MADGTAEIEWIAPEALHGAPSSGEISLFVPDLEPEQRRPPGEWSLAAAHWRGRFRVRYHGWYQLTVAAPSPRVDSAVRRVVRCDMDEVLELVGRRLDRLEGLDVVGPLRADPLVPQQRAPAKLRIPWSRPRLPVWLAVEPWWRDQALVTLWLRSTQRWRYPARYFLAAHRVMDELTRPAAPAP